MRCVQGEIVAHRALEAQAWHVLLARRPYVLALVGFVLLIVTRPAFAVDQSGRYQGTLGGSAYLINVPPDWNGGLVMFAHGYEGEGSGKGTVRSEPLDDYLTKRGYAWAASGYRAWGFRPDWFLLDLLTSSWRISAWTNSASVPSSRSSRARASPASSWRPETTTRLPSRAKAKAAARPIPVNAPVINTTGVLIVPLLRPV